jgi:hypothetical protein
MYKYLIPGFHKEIFGDNKPRTGDEISLALFGMEGQGVVEKWVQRGRPGEANKYVIKIETSKLVGACTKPGWQYVYPRNKHVDLIENIRQNGILFPLTVIKVQGKYEILKGHHRAGAAIMVGLQTVPAFVFERV